MNKYFELVKKINQKKHYHIDNKRLAMIGEMLSNLERTKGIDGIYLYSGKQEWFIILKNNKIMSKEYDKNINSIIESIATLSLGNFQMSSCYENELSVAKNMGKKKMIEDGRCLFKYSNYKKRSL